MAKPKNLNPKDVRFFSGSSNPVLAQAICDELGVPLDTARLDRFPNDNPDFQLEVPVRGREVFFIQSFSPTPRVDPYLVELIWMLDIARSANANNIHAIIPYFSYARSDKKDAPRISIGARLVADLLKTAGATHVMTMTLHSPQVHGFFSVPTDPITSRPALRSYFKTHDLSETIVISPDMGQAKSAARFAHDLGDLPVAAGNKERIDARTVRINGLFGDQIKECKTALIYDDEISTGGTISKISQYLIERGIENICLVCTHGVFVEGALKRLAAIPQVREIVTTDTVFIPPEERVDKLHIVSVASYFADAIRLNFFGESLGSFFS